MLSLSLRLSLASYSFSLVRYIVYFEKNEICTYGMYMCYYCALPWGIMWLNVFAVWQLRCTDLSETWEISFARFGIALLQTVNVCQIISRGFLWKSYLCFKLGIGCLSSMVINFRRNLLMYRRVQEEKCAYFLLQVLSPLNRDMGIVKKGWHSFCLRVWYLQTEHSMRSAHWRLIRNLRNFDWESQQDRNCVPDFI